jgi:hypothetical protein
VRSLTITIERDLQSRSSHQGARFRLKVYPASGGPALLMSPQPCSSVAAARREAEALFGSLRWNYLEGDTRASARVDVAEAQKG